MWVEIHRRLPAFQSILQVYAVVAVLFSGWTITAFLWKLPSWLLLLNMGEILAIFAYSMFANLLESLLILAVLLLLCVLLPAHVLRESFTVRGTVLAVALIGSLMAFLGSHMTFAATTAGALGLVLFELLLLALLAAGFSPRFTSVHSLVHRVSDRLLVFLFILVPMFLLFSFYVLYRNLT